MAARVRTRTREAMAMVVAVVAVVGALGGGVRAFKWQDCLQPGECDEELGCVKWLDVMSSPDPVVSGGPQQNVTKIGHWGGNDAVPALDAYFEQFYDLKGVWVPFLKLKIDVCKQYPEMCPLLAHHDFSESKVHPPFSRCARHEDTSSSRHPRRRAMSGTEADSSTAVACAGNKRTHTHTHTRFTPRGWYRSVQKYVLPGGRVVGCVQLDVEYVKAKRHGGDGAK